MPTVVTGRIYEPDRPLAGPATGYIRSADPSSYVAPDLAE
jgi:hypothetical protein